MTSTKVDWKAIATNPNGRRMLAQLIKEFGEGGDVFCAGHGDKTAYQAGRYSAITTIRMHLNEISPSLYYEILADKAKEDALTKQNRKIEDES